MSDAGLGAQKLHEALTQLQQGRMDAAYHAGCAALEAFSTAADRTGSAAAHQLLGMLALSRGEVESAIEHLEAAIPLRESTGDDAGLASLLQERFEIALRTGDLEGARLWMERQLSAHDRSNDREGRAHALHQLAQLHLQAGEPDRAEALVQDAFWAIEGPGSERARAALVVLSSNIAIEKAQLERAESLARQAVELARQARFRPAELDAMFQLGVVLRLRESWKPALRVLEDALMGRELLKDADGKAQVLRELAAVQVGMGDIDAALGRLQYAAKTLREDENVLGEVSALQALQTLADEHGRPDRARAAAEALVRATDGNAEANAAAWFALATRLASAGELPDAERAFTTSMQIQARLGGAHEAAVAAGMLGQVLAAQGRRDEGIKLLKHALTELDRLQSEAAEAVREILTELSASEAD